ncbi:uncharacterized protein LOC129919046 [Episyrphus balteatus]|uniref:uncharacterized protein LOC129919046 n=1 Tax=Episyrphus balteatus TaxID=286459 RepID=UPI00248633BB|nr:uncharacterized protein LOC129919046 [Episyrphus balteatus]
MATELGRPFRIALIVLFCFIYGYLAATKNYKVQLTGITCKYNSKYAANASCSLTDPPPAVGANFYMQMKSELKDFRLDLIFYLIRKKAQYLIFKAPDVEACVEFPKNDTAVYMQLFKEMTLRAGKWPHCPIPANFYYKFENITPNTQMLPPFAPEVSFKMVFNMKERKESVLEVAVFGKVNRNNLKGKRTH